jgi:hypothetical protein
VLLLRLGLRECTPGIERAGDGPGLRWGAAWMVWRIAVENLAYRSQTLIFQSVANPLQDGERRTRIARDPISGETERSEQPA